MRGPPPSPGFDAGPWLRRTSSVRPMKATWFATQNKSAKLTLAIAAAAEKNTDQSTMARAPLF